eukprot:3402537-Rhodomonas_salina.1
MSRLRFDPLFTGEQTELRRSSLSENAGIGVGSQGTEIVCTFAGKCWDHDSCPVSTCDAFRFPGIQSNLQLRSVLRSSCISQTLHMTPHDWEHTEEIGRDGERGSGKNEEKGAGRRDFLSRAAAGLCSLAIQTHVDSAAAEYKYERGNPIPTPEQQVDSSWIAVRFSEPTKILPLPGEVGHQTRVLHRSVPIYAHGKEKDGFDAIRGVASPLSCSAVAFPSPELTQLIPRQEIVELIKADLTL